MCDLCSKFEEDQTKPKVAIVDETVLGKLLFQSNFLHLQVTS